MRLCNESIISFPFLGSNAILFNVQAPPDLFDFLLAEDEFSVRSDPMLPQLGFSPGLIDVSTMQSTGFIIDAGSNSSIIF